MTQNYQRRAVPAPAAKDAVLPNGSAMSCGPAEEPATPTDFAPSYIRPGHPNKGRQLLALLGGARCESTHAGADHDGIQ